MEDLNNKVIFVTGGARGLGKATVTELHNSGATVIAADVRADELDQLVEETAKDGRKIKPLVMDVCDEHQIEKAIQQIVDEYGHLDVVVNNAGTDKTVPIDELSISDWDHVQAVNIRGPFFLSKLALEQMKKQGKGYIINIASTAAKRAWANAAAYHASKWGLLGFSYALHVEARPYNVKVTALVAGGMKTPFLLERFPDIDVDTLQDPKNVAQTIHFLITMPDETVIPELMVIPMTETSWP